MIPAAWVRPTGASHVLPKAPPKCRLARWCEGVRSDANDAGSTGWTDFATLEEVQARFRTLPRQGRIGQVLESANSLGEIFSMSGASAGATH